MPFSVDLNLSPLDDLHSPYLANALAQARNFHTVLLDGTYYRDTILTPQTTGTQVGLPLSVEAGTYAETYCRIDRAGRWWVEWEGEADLGVVNGSGRGSASTMGLSTPGAFSFVSDPTTTSCQVRIARVNAANPIRNFRIVHESDRATWQGWSAAFVARMASLRPKSLRLMNWFQPNSTWADWPTTWAQRRADNFFTQSSIVLDCWRVHAPSWSGAAPQLGQVVEFRNGSTVLGSGPCVRNSGTIAGVLAHIKVQSYFGDLTTATSAVVPATNSTATLNQGASFVEGLLQGPSFGLIAKLCGDFPALQSLCICWPFTATDDYHTGFAAAVLADSRTNTKTWYGEKGNEPWNRFGPFYRTHLYCSQQAQAIGLPGPNEWERAAQWSLYRWDQECIIWETAFSNAGRASQFKRYRCWQNAANNDYWYDWSTIINPESAAGPHPRRVVPIDEFGTAPYWHTLDGWTAAQILTATDADFNAEIQATVADLVETRMQWWIDKVATRAAQQGGRVCTYRSYEFGPHSVPNGLSGFYSLNETQRAQVVSRLAGVHNGAAMAAGYDRALARYRLRAVPGYAYDDAWSWGEFGFWGHVDRGYDAAGNPNTSNGKWQSLVRNQSGTVHQGIYPDAEVQVFVAAGRAAIAGQRRVGAGWSAAVTVAAGRAQRIVVGGGLGIGVKWEVAVTVAAGGSVRLPGVDPVIHVRRGAPLFAQTEFKPGESVIERNPYVRAGANWTATAVVAAGGSVRLNRIPYVGEGAAFAVTSLVASSTPTLIKPTGTLLAPRNIHGWNAFQVHRLRKRVGMRIQRGAFLSWSLNAEVGADGVVTPVVFPLRTYELFAGVAIDTATEAEQYVEVSLRGLMYVDIAGIVAGDVGVVVAASDDQTLFKWSAGAAGVTVGRAYQDPNGLPGLFYEAESLRWDDGAPSGVGSVPVAPVDS